MKKLLIIGILSILLFSCSTIKIQYDYDYETDFSKFRTFNWKQPSEEGQFKNKLMDKRVRRLVNEALQKKGFFQSDDPDFLVDYHQAARNRKEVTVSHNYNHWRWHGAYTRDIYVNNYREGTLIIDIFEVNKPAMIWRGWAKKIVINSKDAEAKLKQAVEKIFRNFPPEIKS